MSAITLLSVVSTINDLAMLQSALTPLVQNALQTGADITQADLDAAAARTDAGADLLAAAIQRARDREAATAAQGKLV